MCFGGFRDLSGNGSLLTGGIAAAVGPPQAAIRFPGRAGEAGAAPTESSDSRFHDS